MTKAGVVAGVILALGAGGTSAGLFAWTRDGGEQRRPVAPVVRDNSEARAPSRPPTREDRLRSIINEFQAAQMVQARAQAKASTDNERLETTKFLPDTVRFTDRLLALALEQPADRAGLGAAVWIVSQTLHHNDFGSWGAKVKQAMDQLVEYHADSIDVGRLCRSLEDHVSPNRLPFLESLLAHTTNRQVRALATYSLGAYLAVEADTIESIRNGGARMTYIGGGGRLDVNDAEAAVISRERGAYFDSLKKKNPAAERARAIRLLTDVIEHYEDVRDTRVSRRNPGRCDPTRARSLAAAAAAALHDARDLREGKVAPEIDGIDITGAPIKLSNYRGKVVLLVFWSSWCGPCLSQVPQEIALVKKMERRPFTILGVNADAMAKMPPSRSVTTE